MGAMAAAFHWAIRWLRHGLVMGLLVAALVVLNAVTGCNSAEDPVPLYGPPPDTGAGADGRGLDVLSPPDLEGDGQPQVLYGPPPVDTVADEIPEDVQDVLQPPPPYGPPPLDVLDDSASLDVQDVLQPPPPYGPLPVDTIQDSPPSSDCEPVAYYGPPPCDSDAACAESYGDGWYCDQESTFSDGCGGTVEWPVCKEK
ncbi:MAG: hypothetical protein ABIK09_20320 [Pseudomonadota bacterium]